MFVQNLWVSKCENGIIYVCVDLFYLCCFDMKYV
jgi:hypothetical protein